MQISDQRIARFETWRTRSTTNRPLLGCIWEADIPPLPAFFEDRREEADIEPGDVRPELFLPHIENCYRQIWQVECDTIQRFTPAFGMPWVEAIAGCPVKSNPGSIWTEPAISDYADREPVCFSPQNPWLLKLIEFTRAMVEQSDGRFPVAVPQMRGPLDTLAAMRTPQQMCVDFIESPNRVTEVLDELTDLWISIGRAVLEVIPPLQGGYCARMGMWAPGPAITMQNDVSTLISPDLYARFVLPCDKRIAAAFPFTEFHTHASEYHQVDNLLTIDELTAIQFTLEHTLGGPPLENMLPVARRILEKKPLLLTALDYETADECIRRLPAEGLCLTIGFNDYEIPAKFVQWVGQRI